MILKILDSILPGSGTIIKKTIKYFEKGINAFVNALREDWDQLRNPSTESARSSEEVRSDIYEADGEISDLEEKQRYDGGLNDADSERLRDLRRQATDLANEHQISRSKETIAEILIDPHKASETTFSQDFIHVLDGPADRRYARRNAPTVNHRCTSKETTSQSEESQPFETSFGHALTTTSPSSSNAKESTHSRNPILDFSIKTGSANYKLNQAIST